MELPGALGGDGADEAREADESDGRGGVVERRGAEQERQRGPEHREQPEGDRREQQRPAERALPSHDRADGGDQRGVAQPGVRRQRRDGAVERDRQHEVSGGGEGVNPSPAGGVGDEPADRAREDDAADDAGGDGPDDAATFAVVGEVAGEREQDLAADGSQPSAVTATSSTPNDG